MIKSSEKPLGFTDFDHVTNQVHRDMNLIGKHDQQSSYPGEFFNFLFIS